MKPSYRLEPSLDNAYARVARAKQHLVSLKRKHTSFWRSFYPPPRYIDPHIGGTIFIHLSQRLIPPIFGILVGEIIYNLRAALDYLVYELAILDSGQVQEGTQFPIEDRPEGWKRHRTYLLGVSRAHKAILKRLQPYYGCNWTAILRELSNPDKHRDLTNVRLTQILSIEPVSTGSASFNPSIESNTTLFHVRINPRGNAMDMDTDISFEIAFDDGSPVIETLQECHLQVARVIDMFNHDFPRKAIQHILIDPSLIDH